MTTTNKQHPIKGLLAVAGIGLLAVGCSTHTPFVDYSDRSIYASDNTGNIPYVEVGPVTGSAYGYAWNDCSALIKEVLDEARTTAREHAANGMIGVRWRNHAEGTWHETPRCTTRWGWFAAAGVGGLHPWVKIAQFEGRLVYADGDALDKVRSGKVDFREALEAEHQAEMQRKREQRLAREAEEQRKREAKEQRQREEAEGAEAEAAESND
ncbi:MAG: hypothetical protein EA349_00640 [Halomonadaceae bacterium]|nr:MAG: hypothetical protein EA349_00640 [Halomonadaceae bacterium]